LPNRWPGDSASITTCITTAHLSPFKMQKLVRFTALILAAGCSDRSAPKKEDRPIVPERQHEDSGSQLVFHCQSEVDEYSKLRMCDTSDTLCAEHGGCFTRPSAFCYQRSMLSMSGDGWDKELTTACFPAREECQRDHDSVGRIGRPPVQSECLEVRPDEVPVRN
jgi:hypothetical protein